MKKVVFSLIGLILIAMLVLPATALAQPSVCGFYGKVTLNGVNVPDGTTVKAWVNSTQVGKTSTITNEGDYVYILYVAGDYAGENMFFTVGDANTPAAESELWKARANKRIDLSVASDTEGCLGLPLKADRKSASVPLADIPATGVYLNLPLKPGWNLVSVPLAMEDDSVRAVFPGADIVYGWNSVTNSYYIATEIEPHHAYWVTVLNDMEVSLCGTPIYNWTANLTPGRNMIGSVFETVDFADSVDTPDGSVEPLALNWNPLTKSYVHPTTIEPMGGYWVVATQSCTLTLSCP